MMLMRIVEATNELWEENRIDDSRFCRVFVGELSLMSFFAGRLNLLRESESHDNPHSDELAITIS